MPDPQQSHDDDPSMDFHALMEASIRHLEVLAPDQWTDYNAHDPGITILEQVCWALADLGYRLDHPIEDILAEDGAGATSEETVPAPHQALGCAPVTMDDLRRIVFDVPGVHNVWIEPAEPEHPLFYNYVRRTLGNEDREAETKRLTLTGLWIVQVAGREPEDATDGTMKEQVVRRLFAARPLCQDFAVIDVLTPENIRVDADIEVTADADPEALMVEVLSAIDRQISPRPRFVPVRDALSEGRRFEDIYEGPTLQHGVIAPESMPGTERPAEIHASDILRAVMDIEGVRAVRRLRLALDGVNKDDGTLDWRSTRLPLSGNRAPLFDPRHGDVLLRLDQMPLRSNFDRVAQRFLTTRHADRGDVADRRAPKPPAGRPRDIGTYQSILHQFPNVYGVGPAGLPPTASVERRARMLQLKAYLQIFDQLIANAFSQAANAGALLNGADVQARVYRAGWIEADGLGLDRVRRVPEAYQSTVESEIEAENRGPFGIALRRRQLDHLLARWGETFTDPVPLDDRSGAQMHGDSWDGLADRAAFLARIVDLGATRSTAANDLEPHGAANRSGLEERIAQLLCLDQAAGEAFLMVEHLLLRMLQEDASQTVPLLRDAASADPYSLQLSFIFPAERGRFSTRTADGEGFRRLAEHVIRDATPAHLSPYVHWLDEEQFEAAETAIRNWRDRRRAALMRHFRLEGALP